MLPVVRRCSDDRCSLLTQWTESTASLKSCVSHSAVYRLLHESAESDGGAYRRRAGSGHTQPGHRNRSRGHRLDTTSSSKRFVDASLSSQRSKNHSRKREFAGAAIQQRCGNETTRRTVSQSSSTRRYTGTRRSRWSTSTACRRRATARDVPRASMTVNNNNYDDDDDHYATTSSEGEEHPSTSTSSFAPPSCVDDRASLLSSSGSAVFIMPPPNRLCHRSSWQPAEPSLKHLSRHALPSPRRRKSTGSSRSLTTSNDMDDDDDELERSKSSEEIAVASRHPTEVVTGQFREDELRAVKSLFEFRSSDELRIANDFIDGVWSLYSRRSLYNERYVCSRPASLKSAPSAFPLHLCSRSEKEFQSNVDCDYSEIVANDHKKSNSNDVTGSEQCSRRTEQNNQDVVDDDNSSRDLKVAHVEVRCDGVDALDDWEVRPLEMIAELTDVTATISNDDDLKIIIRKSPKTFNDIPNYTRDRVAEVLDAEHRAPLSKLVKTGSDKQRGHAAVSEALLQQKETAALCEKSPALSTLLSDWLASGSGAKMTEADDNKSRFASELIQVFDALLVRSDVTGTASLAADIKMFQPLTNVANGCTAKELCDTSRLLQVDTGSIATTLAKPTGDEFGTVARTPKSGKRAAVSRKDREGESDILWRLTPRLSMKPDLTCDLASTKTIDPISRNAIETISELASPKQPAFYENGCMTATTSTQTNDFIDDPQSTGESRMRISRKSRGRGKVRELIRLFESASASALTNGASPTDVKRATISAAVSVGELLRRASEQQLTSCSQYARAFTDITDKRPRISSPKSAEALSNAEVAQTPHLSGDECFSKPEAPIAVHKSKSTARWPTMSHIRRKHFRRHVHTTTAADCAPSRIDLDRCSKTHKSTPDARTTPANNDSKNLPQGDDTIRNTLDLETVPLTSKDGMKLMNDDSCKCHDASIIHSASSSLKIRQPDAHGCEVANIASTSNLSSPVVVNGLPTVNDSVSSMPLADRQEHVYQLPALLSSSSASLQWQLKSLHACSEVAVTANTLTPSGGGSGDVGGHHEEAEPASSDCNEQSGTQVTDKVKPTNYIVHGSPLSGSVGLPREQSTAASPNSAVDPETTSKSSKTSSPEVATNDNCRRISVQSWFIAGGPRLVEVPRWLLIPGKDAVAVLNRGKSTARHPAKATLGIETDCPVAYPVVRMAGVTVHLLNKEDVITRHIAEGNETSSVECTADSYSRGGRRQRTQSTKKQSRSCDFQAVKRESSRTATKLTKDEEQLSEKFASWSPKNETVCSAAVTKTAGLDQVFDVTLAAVRCAEVPVLPGAAFRGRGDAQIFDADKNHDRLERQGKSGTNPVPSTNQSTTLASDLCPRSVESHAPSNDPLSKRSSPGKQSNTTPHTTTSFIPAKCGLSSSGSVQSLGGVTVVYSRRRSTPERPSDVAVTAPPRVRDRTQPETARLAYQFLLTSLLEYRLDAQRQ